MWDGIVSVESLKYFDNSLSDDECEKISDKICEEGYDCGFEYESDCIKYLIKEYGSLRNYLYEN